MVQQYNPSVRDRPINQTMVRVGTTSDSFGGAEGRAMADLGRGIGRVGEALMLRDRVERDSRNRLRDAELQTQLAEASYSTDGYFSKTGVNALGQNREEYMKTLDRITEQQASQISDPQEREDFLAAAELRKAQYAEAAFKHESGQSRDTAIASYDSSRLAAEERALLNYNDDDLFEEALAEAVGFAREQGAFVGTDSATQGEVERQIVSNTLRSRAIIMADKDPTAAMAYIEKEKASGRLTVEHARELEDNLEPLVIQHNAEQMVRKHTVTVNTPVGSPQGNLATIIAAESAGNPNAQNPDSSAGGLLQITDATMRKFLGTLEREGRLTPAELAMTPEERMRLRFDKDWVARNGDRWMEELSAPLRNIGKPVTLGNQYVVHHMGPGGGPALLTAGAGERAADVYARNGWSWSAVVRDNPRLFTENMTAAQAVAALHQYVGSKTGLGAGANGSGTVGFNAAAALAEANQIEDPDQRAATIAAIQTRQAELQTQQLAEQGAAIEAATNRYVETGSTTLTTQEKLTLGDAGLSAFTTFVERDRTNTLADNPVLVDSLLTMAASVDQRTQKEFVQPGYLEQFRHEMTRSQYASLLDTRRALSSQLEGQRVSDEAKLANPSLAVTVSDDDMAYAKEAYTAASGEAGDKQEEATRSLEMRRRLQKLYEQFYVEKRREPSPSERRAMVDSLMLPTKTGGW